MPASDARPGSAGVLIPNTEMKIVDINDRSVLGEGREGEVAIRGPQVMKVSYYDTVATTKGFTFFDLLFALSSCFSFFPLFFLLFSCESQLYMRVCPSGRRSVCRSVGLSVSWSVGYPFFFGQRKTRK